MWLCSFQNKKYPNAHKMPSSPAEYFGETQRYENKKSCHISSKYGENSFLWKHCKSHNGSKGWLFVLSSLTKLRQMVYASYTAINTQKLWKEKNPTTLYSSCHQTRAKLTHSCCQAAAKPSWGRFKQRLSWFHNNLHAAINLAPSCRQLLSSCQKHHH